MTHANTDPRPAADGSSPSPRGRRAMLAAGATAALGAAGVVLARPAEAAAGGALLLGRANTAGINPTTLNVTSKSSGMTVHQAGLGFGLFVLSNKSSGVIGRTLLAAKWGVYAQNTAAVTGAGGALRAQGMHNVGLYADTAPAVNNVPAIYAIGGDGANGIAQQAVGQSYFDGAAQALQSYVGVYDSAVASHVSYVPVVSNETISPHTLTASATLDGSGNATVTFSKGYTDAITSAAPFVTLTAVGGAMPNLHVGTVSATGFTIAGGTSGGTVHYVVWGDRLAITLNSATVSSPAKATLAAKTSASVRKGRPTIWNPTD